MVGLECTDCVYLQAVSGWCREHTAKKTHCSYMGHEGVMGCQVSWDLAYKLDFVRFIDKKRQRVKCGLKEWVLVTRSGLKYRSVHREVD